MKPRTFIFHLPKLDCWKWSVHHQIDGNTEALFTGHTLTRAAAEAQVEKYRKAVTHENQ